MVEWSAVAAGTSVVVVAIAVGLWVPFPEVVWPVAIGTVLATGFRCGYVAGRRSDDRWRTRARIGGLAGAAGGVVFAIVLWASMSGNVPRAKGSPFWAINDAIATRPIGIDRVPWLYTDDTMFWLLFVVLVGLFAAEGYVAAGATGEAVRSPVRSW